MSDLHLLHDESVLIMWGKEKQKNKTKQRGSDSPVLFPERQKFPFHETEEANSTDRHLHSDILSQKLCSELQPPLSLHV